MIFLFVALIVGFLLAGVSGLALGLAIWAGMAVVALVTS